MLSNSSASRNRRKGPRRFLKLAIVIFQRHPHKSVAAFEARLHRTEGGQPGVPQSADLSQRQVGHVEVDGDPLRRIQSRGNEFGGHGDRRCPK